MLHEFLLAERDGILALCSQKMIRLADSRSSSDELERGLPVFYDELIEVVRADTDESREASNNNIESVHRVSAKRRGKESLKLGYSISRLFMATALFVKLSLSMCRKIVVKLHPPENSID